jgi:hypothetical protein
VSASTEKEPATSTFKPRNRSPRIELGGNPPRGARNERRIANGDTIALCHNGRRSQRRGDGAIEFQPGVIAEYSVIMTERFRQYRGDVPGLHPRIQLIGRDHRVAEQHDEVSSIVNPEAVSRR